MSVCWYLECGKCQEAGSKLRDVQMVKMAEEIESDGRFHLSEYDEEIDAEKLQGWLTKHKEHGIIKYTGN